MVLIETEGRSSTNGFCTAAVSSDVAAEFIFTVGSVEDFGNAAPASIDIAAARTNTEVRKALFFIFSIYI